MDNKHSLEWELIEMLQGIIHKLIVTIIIVAMLFSCTVAAFIWYLNQYDFESTDTQISASTNDSGTAIAILGDNKGKVNLNGKSCSPSKDEE